MPVWATKVAGLSTSLIVSVPPVLSTASVSLRLTVALPSTAASLVPVMLTVTTWAVPSSVVTVKRSAGKVWPAPSACTAGSALFRL